jgi:D-alanyl-D-alanine carboxypeptidase
LSRPLLDDHLQEVLRAGVPGVVIVANGPGLSWEQAAGVSDVENRAPMTLEHRFRIASVTKLYVATVVLQLVDEGAFELDEEVGLIEGGVTVRQLLNHTSGLPHGVELKELLEPYRVNLAHRPEWTPRDMLRLIQSRPRLSAPGEGWYYSGSNYVVLGLLVEETTGESLSEALRQRVLDPLGLVDTELPELSTTPAGLTRGYLPADNPVLPGPSPGPVDVSEVEPFGWGGGGMVSSARDVARFLQALLGGELLVPRMQAEMLRTVPSDWEESDGYGLGIEEVTSLWGIEQSTCGPAWGHFGLSLGYTTIALGSRNGDRQVVVMFNTHPLSEETWPALGRLVWRCYCI